MQLAEVLDAWGTPSFEPVLKAALISQAGQLPLQQALAHSSSVADGPISVVLRGVEEKDGRLCVDVGIFFHGVTGGCSCADDPTPLDENNEYCRLQLDIDRDTAVTAISLLD
jgi:hypothetical protein